jgi:hypothetical protein
MPLAALIDWLKIRHAAIKALEADALKALHEQGDEGKYRALMQQRAQAIADLGEDSKPLTADLPGQERALAVSSLSRFSRGAQNALSIGSVFYMSALLYPDEYNEGEPDNLERLISELGAMSR